MSAAKTGRRAGRRLLAAAAALVLTAGTALSAAAAPGYYYGKITVVDEPDTFSAENVTYYIKDKATAVSEMVWVDGGHTGKALKLSGNGEFLRLGYTAARATEFTFSGWVNWQGAAADGTLSGQRLLTVARSTENYLTVSPYVRDETVTADGGFLNGIYLEYRYGGDGGKTVRMFNPAADGATYALPMREWHHIAVVSDGMTYKLYIDGVRWFEEQILTTVAELGAYSLDIGAGEWGDATLNALLDDVTLYNSALSAARVAELAGMDTQGTTAYLPTAPSTSSSPVAPTAAPETGAQTQPSRTTLGRTLWGIPMWGIYTIIGLIVLYAVLTLVLNLTGRRRVDGTGENHAQPADGQDRGDRS